MKKKIGVIGVGAIGGSLGGFMALNGEDVTLIDGWRENVEAIREHGLLLDGSTGEHRVRAEAVHIDELDKLDVKFDLLIVAVKTYDSQRVTKLMLPFLKEDSLVISPQNSINELLIAPIVGARRTIGCVTMISAAMMEPGHVTRTDSAAQAGRAEAICFKVGELDGTITPRVEELARMFEPAGRTVVTDDIWGERWTKLTINCMANSTAAMTGLNTYEIRSGERSRRLMLKLGAESTGVGRALGYNAQVPIAGFNFEDLKAAANEGHPELEKAFAGKPLNSPGRPSMAQDVIKGLSTEIDYLNGFVVEEGRRIGMPTPYNAAVVPVVKGIESGEFEVGLENVDRVEAMVAAGDGGS